MLTSTFFDFCGHCFEFVRWRLFENIVQSIETHLQQLCILLLQQMTRIDRRRDSSRVTASQMRTDQSGGRTR